MISFALSQVTSAAIAADQIDTTTSNSNIAPWILAVIGGVVILLALVLVLRNMPVSTGHSIFLGAGVALVALPLVSKFEWSQDKFSFELKSAAQDLTKEVSRLAEDNKAIRGELLQLSSALQTAAAKIEQKSDAPDTATNTPSDTTPALSDWSKYSSPSFFDDLMVRNKAAIANSERSLDNLDTIQKQLQLPPQ
jgi:multidrug transporter EmrE-like cation transporter